MKTESVPAQGHCVTVRDLGWGHLGFQVSGLHYPQYPSFLALWLRNMACLETAKRCFGLDRCWLSRHGSVILRPMWTPIAASEFLSRNSRAMPGVILASSHHIGSPRPSGEKGLGVRGGALSQLSAWSRPNKPARRGNSDARL